MNCKCTIVAYSLIVVCMLAVSNNTLATGNDNSSDIQSNIIPTALLSDKQPQEISNHPSPVCMVNLSVILLSPNGFEFYKPAELQQIKWQSSGGVGTKTVTIAYSSTGINGNYITIATNVSDSVSYLWRTPFVNSRICYVRIIVSDGTSTAMDTSDYAFTVSIDIPIDYPRLEMTKTVNQSWFYLNNTGLYPDSAMVNLTIKGVGNVSYEYSPADIVLAIDTTGSMSEALTGASSKLDGVKIAAKSFIDSINYTSGDRVAIYQFDSTISPIVKQRVSFSNDIPALKSAIDSFVAGGNTPFYDAVGATIDYAALHHYSGGRTHPHETLVGHHRPVVIALTDGVDTGSMNHDLISVLEFTAKMNNKAPPVYMGYDVSLYTIGVGTTADYDEEGLRALAKNGEGIFYPCDSLTKLNNAYQDAKAKLHLNPTYRWAAENINYSTPALRIVFPSQIELVKNSLGVGSQNTVPLNWGNLSKNASGITEYQLFIPSIKIGQALDLHYTLRSNQLGYQYLEVTKNNKSGSGNNYSALAMKNCHYASTHDASYCWVNETPPATAVVIDKTPTPLSAFIIEPMGGENWTADTVQEIRWTASGGVGMILVSICFTSVEEGNSIFWMANDLPNTGIFNWTVPHVIYREWRIILEVRDLGGNNITITSNPIILWNPDPPVSELFIPVLVISVSAAIIVVFRKTCLARK